MAVSGLLRVPEEAYASYEGYKGLRKIGKAGRKEKVLLTIPVVERSLPVLYLLYKHKKGEKSGKKREK